MFILLKIMLYQVLLQQQFHICGQDCTMLNTVVTKLNSQLPDATIVLKIQLPAVIQRFNGFYYFLNSTEVLQSQSQSPLCWSTSNNNCIHSKHNSNRRKRMETSLTISSTVPLNFAFVVDDMGNGFWNCYGLS